MEKKHSHSNKDFGYLVGRDAIFTKHLTDLCDQINALQKALANSPGDNLLKIATVSNELDKIFQNFKDHSLQCKRCGHEWLYHGKNPDRARCIYCGTTVMAGSSIVGPC
jgi:hypothetical protein